MSLRRRAVTSIGTAALAIASAILTPGTATAQDWCTQYNHCYAIGEFGAGAAGQGPVYMNAVYSILEADCLWVNNPFPPNFVDYELWMNTNNNDPNSYT